MFRKVAALVRAWKVSLRPPCRSTCLAFLRLPRSCAGVAHGTQLQYAIATVLPPPVPSRPIPGAPGAAKRCSIPHPDLELSIEAGLTDRGINPLLHLVVTNHSPVTVSTLAKSLFRITLHSSGNGSAFRAETFCSRCSASPVPERMTCVPDSSRQNGIH